MVSVPVAHARWAGRQQISKDTEGSRGWPLAGFLGGHHRTGASHRSWGRVFKTGWVFQLLLQSPNLAASKSNGSSSSTSLWVPWAQGGSSYVRFPQSLVSDAGQSWKQLRSQQGWMLRWLPPSHLELWNSWGCPSISAPGASPHTLPLGLLLTLCPCGVSLHAVLGVFLHTLPLGRLFTRSPWGVASQAAPVASPHLPPLRRLFTWLSWPSVWHAWASYNVSWLLLEQVFQEIIVESTELHLSQPWEATKNVYLTFYW